METVLETISRSSWGVLPLHTGIGLIVLAVAAVLAWFLLRASWRPQAWRGDRGQGLVEVLLAVFLILVILFVLFRLI
jgi:heme/copper-type cytochrome/quinol oxidase subunit 2